MANSSEEVPIRLKRAQMVVDNRTDSILLVLERVTNLHNIQATLRTAEALGVQYVWTVKPAYVKGAPAKAREMAAPEDVVAGEKEPPVHCVGTLNRYFLENKLKSPLYTTCNVAPKGRGDIWRTTVEIFDGRKWTGTPDDCKKVAMRRAAYLALREVAPELLEREEVEAPPPPPPVEPPGRRKQEEKSAASTSVTKGSERWLSIRSFDTPTECIKALREQGWAIWATDLSPGAVPLNFPLEDGDTMPPKVAVVIGSEAGGVSAEMLQEADRRVFLPMYGFTESFNLSVATALILQRLFDCEPTYRGNLSRESQRRVKETWWDLLASTEGAKLRLAPHKDAFMGGVDGIDDPREGREVRIRRILRKTKKKEEAHYSRHTHSPMSSPSTSLAMLLVGAVTGAALARTLSRGS